MKRKKVGILTLPLRNNYGGIIQLIALYHFLEEEKFQPVWIDKRQWHKPMKSAVIKLLEYNPLYKLYDPKEFAKSKNFLSIIKPFLEKYLPQRTSPIYSQKQLEIETDDFYAVLVGSDQVWRLEYTKDNYPTYFLDFLSPDKKRIAYAASFGKDHWEGGEESVKKISKLLSKFDLISVREDAGVEVCQNKFLVENVSHVLDPSFLPEVDFYDKMIFESGFKEDVQLFNYVLDPTETSAELVKHIAQTKGLKINKIYLSESNLTKDATLLSKWLAHFYYADFVVTDSFHGMIFSIIFNKQFLVVGNKKRGLSRFTSLLNLLELEDRLVETTSSLANCTEAKIDYDSVNQKLDKLREKSKRTLIHSLLD